MTPDQIPQRLVDILDRRAGRVHSRGGVVMAALAEILTEWSDMAISFRPAVVPSIVSGNEDTVLWVHMDSRCSMVTPSTSPNQRPAGPCYVCGVDGPWALLYFRVVDGAVDTQPVPETTEGVTVIDATHTDLTAADLRETAQTLPSPGWNNQISSVVNRRPPYSCGDIVCPGHRIMTAVCP